MEQARLRADRLHTGRGWADQHEQGERLVLAQHMTSSIIAIGLSRAAVARLWALEHCSGALCERACFDCFRTFEVRCQITRSLRDVRSRRLGAQGPAR